MGSLISFKAQSVEKLKIAEHLLTTTYVLVKEPKLLMSVVENIYFSFDDVISAFIEYEKQFTQLPSFSQSFDSKFDIFKKNIVPKYSISEDVLKFILSIKVIYDIHQKSQVEFTHKEKFIITDENYNTQSLSFENITALMSKAKEYHTLLLSKLVLE